MKRESLALRRTRPMTRIASHRVDSWGNTRWLPPRVAALAVGVLVAACGPPHRVVELPMPPVLTGEAAMHAVHNRQLREVMRGLRGASRDRLPQELDDPSRQRASLRDLSSHAQDLANDADRIVTIVDQTGLTTNEKQVFLRLAERLRSGALQLGEQADLRQTRLITTTMTEIDDTCAACHALFRAPPELAPEATP